MARTDFAALWDTPDAKRERAPGTWDVYCAQCGRFVDSVASPLEPYSVRCRRCRTCSRCGEQGTGGHIDGEGFVCDVCLALPVGHVAAEEQMRCTRCGVPLLPNEHTREQGICHSCWSADMAYGASERHEPRAE